MIKRGASRPYQVGCLHERLDGAITATSTLPTVSKLIETRPLDHGGFDPHFRYT